MRLFKKGNFGRLLVLIVGAAAGASAWSVPVRAAPVATSVAAQRITVQVKRLSGTGKLLAKGLQAKVIAKQIQWQYIPETAVSIPYVQIQLTGFPTPNPFNVLVERTQALPYGKQGPILTLPLLKKRNHIRLTVVDPDGRYEDWNVEMNLNLAESSVYVDETCRDFTFKIRELRRTSEASLIYLGCQIGSRPGDLSLEMAWSDLDRVVYQGSTSRGGTSVMSIPLDSRHNTAAELTGFLTSGGSTVFQIDYEPYLPPPFEVWAGVAFFRNTFKQSNFPANFKQIGTAFLGQFWYRPDDVKLSVMVRGFGSLLSASQTLTPDQGYSESVSTYFLDAEVRYAVLDTHGWRLDPFIGGWAYFQSVDSRNFGIQRILDPMLGFVLQKKVGKRDSIGATVRFVPLQAFINPFTFSLPQSYLELELTYVHAFRKAHRVFATMYLGQLSYQPDGFASATGSYLVAGGGYGW